MAPYTHICACCGHPITAHRIDLAAQTVLGPYCCYYERCACRIMQTDPVHSIHNKADFERRFPQWPRQLRPIPTRVR